MRTNIDIDDLLLKEAMEATRQSTKRATVEEALRRVVLDYRRRQAIADMKGLGWVGDLDASREGRDTGLEKETASPGPSASPPAGWEIAFRPLVPTSG